MTEPLEYRIAPAHLLSVLQLANSPIASGYSIARVDASDDLVVIGKFFKSIDVDPGPGVQLLSTTDPAGDLFIAKYAPDNTLIWAKTWGGTGAESPEDIAFDAAGDIFASGEFSSTNAGFGAPGTLSALGAQDAFLLKFSGADGSAVTAFDGDGQLRFGGTDTANGVTETGFTLGVDSTGAVFMGGWFNSMDASINGGSLTVQSANLDGYVLKVSGATGLPDANFGIGGVVTLGGDGDDHVVHLIVDGNNDIFVAATEAFNGAETAEVIKMSGADGNRPTTFGTLGKVVVAPTNNSGDFTPLDIGRAKDGQVVVAVGVGQTTEVMEFDPSTGAMDPDFNGGTFATLNFNSKNYIYVNVDHHGQIYVSGATQTGAGSFVARVSVIGQADGIILSSPTSAFFQALDSHDNLILRGTYSGSADLDPTNGVSKLPSCTAAQLGTGMVDGYIARVDLYGLDAANPLVFHDFDGDVVKVTMTGAGSAHYKLFGDVADNSDLDTLEMFGTNLTTTVSITTPTNDTSVEHILTHDAEQHVGSITLGANVFFGDETEDNVPDLHVSGKLNKLVLGDVSANTLIQLGDGLPYNVTADTTTPDTYNNHPDVTIGNIGGPGVQLNVIGDGVTAGGVGGGGLGKVVIGSWAYHGFIRTTQSIGDFTVLHENFNAVLEVDKFHLGALTQADCGHMTITNGAWGSSGSEIEGDVASFDADAFLAGATLTAASVGSVSVNGDFDGVIILTDPDSPAIPAFTVNTNYTGVVMSSSPLKSLRIHGDFKGSLQAPSIGSITAYSFLGENDTSGDPLTFIKTTVGGLGTLTATAGPISDFSIVTNTVFKGISVNLTNVKYDTIGIDNVHITATSIGNISVALKASVKATDLDLIGIRNSDFITTATGTTKLTAGTMGTISVTLTGAAGGTSAIGIVDSTFDALVGTAGNPLSTINTMGAINVKLSGQSGSNVGLSNVSFEANSIGAVTANVSRGPNVNSTGLAMDGVDFSATGSIGALTVSGNATGTQITGMDMWAGGTIGAISVRSNDLTHGSIDDSSVLAGQLLDLSGNTTAKQLAHLSLAKLTSVFVSGSISQTELIAGGSIGAVTVGKDMTNSVLLAGAIPAGNGFYQRVASIAGLTVKGLFAHSSVAAGVNPGIGAIGDGDDTLGHTVQWVNKSSSIGAIVLGASSGASGSPSGSHDFGIEAATIASLRVGTVTLKSLPVFLDLGSTGEDTDDVIARTIPETI